jgi:hypothetical protein
MDIKQKYEAAQAKADALKKRMLVAARTDAIKKRKAENHLKAAAGGALLAFLEDDKTLTEKQMRDLLSYCEFGITQKEPHRSLWEAKKIELLARFGGQQ